jgi:rfaE bifunctional protein nucleotidyltransferase chain/domain
MKQTEVINQKILTIANLPSTLARLKFLNKKIVFTNGCFDIIHQGHVHYLAEAANLGDVFIIGLNSDKSVQKIKGMDRPVQDQKSRALVLAAMFFVSFVVVFDEETPYKLINAIQPDILVKGGDYKEIERIVGYDIVTKKGGEVLTIPFLEGFSSTSIINKIIKL